MSLRDSNRLTDAVVFALTSQCSDLTYLDFQSCNKITDDGVSDFSNCVFLFFLLTMLPSSQLEYVAVKCSKLQSLFLSFGFSISNEGFRSVLASCLHLGPYPILRIEDHSVECVTLNLENLSIELCNKVTNEGMEIFGTGKFLSLAKLNVWGCTRYPQRCPSNSSMGFNSYLV